MIPPWELPQSSHYELEIEVFAVTGGDFVSCHKRSYPLTFNHNVIMTGPGMRPGLSWSSGQTEKDLDIFLGDNAFGECVFQAINESSTYKDVRFYNVGDCKAVNPLVIVWEVKRYHRGEVRDLGSVMRMDTYIGRTVYRAKGSWFALASAPTMQPKLFGPYEHAADAEQGLQEWLDRAFPNPKHMLPKRGPL